MEASSPVPKVTTSEEDIILENKKKLSMLKKALRDAREERKQGTQRLQRLKETSRQLDLQIADKNNQISRLAYEKEDLQAELINLQERAKEMASNPSPSSPISQPKSNSSANRSILALEQQNAKLQEEYDDLKSKINTIEQETMKIQEEYDATIKLLETNDEDLRKTDKEIQKKLEEIEEKLETLREEKTKILKTNINLSEANSRLEEETEDIRSKIKENREYIIKLTKELEQKHQYIEILKERICRHEDEETKMAMELLDYKNELLEAQSVYYKYDVLKIRPILNTLVKLVIKKNLDGVYVIEIQQSTKKLTYLVKDIESIYLQQNRPNRFVIKFNVRYIQNEFGKEFESPESEAIMNNIRNLLIKVLETEAPR